MTICCVLGLGYIGLPTAATLAHAGHRVIGVDLNAEVVETVNQGQLSLILKQPCLRVLPLVLSRPKSGQPRQTYS